MQQASVYWAMAETKSQGAYSFAREEFPPPVAKEGEVDFYQKTHEAGLCPPRPVSAFEGPLPSPGGKQGRRGGPAIGVIPRSDGPQVMQTEASAIGGNWDERESRARSLGSRWALCAGSLQESPSSLREGRGLALGESRLRLLHEIVTGPAGRTRTASPREIT